MQEAPERRTGVYSSVHEDSSTAATWQATAGVELPKGSIHANDQGPWGRPKGGGSGNGGGGWNPGGRSPRGPSGDFDKFLHDLRQHLNRFFGGGHNNRGIAIALSALLGLWLVSGMYQVQPGESGVVTRFGKFDRITSPGLRYHLPSPLESVDIVNVERARNETLGGDPNAPPHGGSSGTGEDEILMLTGDENIINVSFSVQWTVADARSFAFNIADPVRTVRMVAESAMREVIGQTPIEAAMTTGKSKISYETLTLTQETLDRYKAGIQIKDVNLLDASFPQAVVDAARDVQAAQADQESARNTAEGYHNDILPRARGQASRMVQEAEAYKQQVVAQAEGSASRFVSVYQQYKQAQDVTRKRMYLETMEKILEGTNKVILDNRTGAVPYLPLPAVKAPSQTDSKAGQ